MKGTGQKTSDSGTSWRSLLRPRSISILLGVAICYAVIGRIGLLIPFTATLATLIWAPSGIALYAVLRWGKVAAVGVALGAFAVGLSIGQTIEGGIFTALASAAAPLIAARFLAGPNFAQLFGDTARVSRFVAIAVIASTSLSALVGATVLKTIGAQVPADWLTIFATWWAGDAMGVLVVTPTLFALGALRRRRQPRQIFEFLLLAAGFAVIWYLVFAEILTYEAALPLSYAAIPLVIWIAVRFDQSVVLPTAFVLILVAIIATARGLGPFVESRGVEQSYVFLDGYLAVIAAIALYLSASASSNRRALTDLQHEVQEQRRIRARLVAINELSGDAIVTINRGGQITSFNPAAVTLFGYALTDVIGQSVECLIPARDVPARRLQLDAFFDGGDEPLKMERFQQIAYCRKDGSVFNALGAFARIRTDQLVSGIIAIRDMTAFEQKEGALRDALREAQLAIRAKNEFLANMSHELRTPLNAVIGFAETLRLRLFGELNPRQIDYVGDIEASGRHLLTLINGILNYARLENSNWMPAAEPVDVGLAIAASCRMLTDKARLRQITLRQSSAASLPNLLCDPVALRQIVINLVDNAIKFSHPKGTIDISAVLAQGGDGLILTVVDQGIGIHESDRQRVLEPFTQAAHASTRDHDGLGLGLSIVRRLVMAHQAQLSVESTLGEGTSIRIHWPAERLLRSA
ncbi:MAG: ATP-binding protein [Dongiaceae bacterium]